MEDVLIAVGGIAFWLFALWLNAKVRRKR